MIYICLLCWILWMAFLCFCPRGVLYFNSNNKTPFLVASIIAATMVMGLRSVSVGQDTLHYSEIFQYVSHESTNNLFSSFYYQSIEIGYIALMKIVSVFGGYYLFQMVVSCFICGFFAKFISENMNNYFLGMVLFLGFDAYLMSFNISRHMLAVILVANGWSSLNRGKIKKAFLYSLLATLIHTTAIAFLAIYVLYVFRKNKFVIRLIPVLGILAVFSYRKILMFVSSYVTHYNNYYSNHKNTLQVGYAWIIWTIIVAISILLILKTRNLDENIEIQDDEVSIKAMSWSAETYLYSSLGILYVATNIVGMSFNYFERLGLYFVPFVFVVFERFGQYIQRKVLRQMYYFALMISFIVYFIISSQSAQYVYSFFWN